MCNETNAPSVFSVTKSMVGAYQTMIWLVDSVWLNKLLKIQLK